MNVIIQLTEQTSLCLCAETKGSVKSPCVGLSPQCGTWPFHRGAPERGEVRHLVWLGLEGPAGWGARARGELSYHSSTSILSVMPGCLRGDCLENSLGLQKWVRH